jgi:hypothetical protein
VLMLKMGDATAAVLVLSDAAAVVNDLVEVDVEEV